MSNSAAFLLGWFLFMGLLSIDLDVEVNVCEAHSTPTGEEHE